MPAYKEQLQRVWHAFTAEHGTVPATAREAVQWGVSRGMIVPPEIDPLDKLAEDMSTALREEYGAVTVEANSALLLVAAVQFFTQPFQPPNGLGFQPAISQFLDAIGQAGFKVAPIERRWLAIEQVTPLVLQVGCRGGLQCGEARGNGVMCGHAGLRSARVA